MGDRFDLTDGGFLCNVGGGMMMNNQGHLMQDFGPGMALDLQTGEMHMTSMGSSNPNPPNSGNSTGHIKK